MSPKNRQIMAVLFILAFFALAPIVVLWAEGYRYDFSKNRFLKTGVFFIESKPTKADIYLNDKKQSDKTPTRLKYVLPGNYTLQVKKDGYQTWQKKLPVYAGQTTFAQYIRLFKELPEETNLISNNLSLYSQLINNSLAVIYFDQENIQLSLINLRQETEQKLAILNYLPEKIELSPNANYIYLKYSDEYQNQNFVFDINTKEIINLEKIIGGSISYSWQPNVSDENIYFQFFDRLEKLNLSSLKTEILFDNQKLISFYIQNNSIYFIQTSLDKKQYSLKKSSLNNPEKFETITTLPISEKYTLDLLNNSLLSVLDETNSMLYLIDLKNDNKKTIISDVNSVELNENILLLTNAYEISAYDLEQEKQNLILRLSSKIKSAKWYPVPTHCLYLNSDKITAVENIDYTKFSNSLGLGNFIQDFFIISTEKIAFIDKNGLSILEIQ